MNVTALALNVLEATCSKAVGRAPFAGNKKPAEAGFADHTRHPWQAAILAWSFVLDLPERFLRCSPMCVDYAGEGAGNNADYRHAM
ncbi:hypothetical protein [Pseudomonas luteola]|uniref:Uncharacterized protein n=1 Tax=Pseudomonas luteola TaxID=47886 RepID=A0ABS0MT94_PSELU|nr:hypothetical protein [Pseudomonas luteola]MBH3439937.1 hypothetical protein [Pseudomonas luteola]